MCINAGIEDHTEKTEKDERKQVNSEILKYEWNKENKKKHPAILPLQEGQFKLISDIISKLPISI